MRDQYDREINYMRLSVTDRCNLRCCYCMPEEGVCKKTHEEMLTEDEMIAAVEAGASLGITKLRITGGEPLVKRNIITLCARAAKVEGIREVAITTNGVLLPKLAKGLRAVGVSRVNLSLDTLNPDKYARITRIGTLSSALAGLDAALNAGFPPRLLFARCTGCRRVHGSATKQSRAIDARSCARSEGRRMPRFSASR